MTKATVQWFINVDVAVYKNGEYLIIVRGLNEAHAPGTISLPGGKVEGEQVIQNILEETARREVLEETGVLIDEQIIYTGSKHFISDDGRPFVAVDFLAFYKSGDIHIDDEGEVAGVEWCAVADLLADSHTPPWTRESIIRAENARLKLATS